MTNKTPLAFFAYNRPDHTRRTLEALSRCRRLEDCEFYFFSDGPRTEANRLEVEATRTVLREWVKPLGARLVEQPQNLGLAKSIVTGVSDLCDRYGRVIVVEDDLIVSPDFLNYMIQALDHYQDSSQVLQVGGYTLSPPPGISTDAFLLPVTTTWGWATWQRAWRHFSWEPVDLEVAKLDQDWLTLFNLDGACEFSAMLEDRLAGRNDSWGILWWYAVSRQRGLTVYPSKSLVWNGGFDGSGVHCGSSDFLNQGEISERIWWNLPAEVAFPTSVRYEPKHLLQLETFLRSGQIRTIPEDDAPRVIKILKEINRNIKTKLRHAFSG